MTVSPRPGSRRGRSSFPPVDPAAFLRSLDEAATHFRAGRLDAAAQIYRRLERQAPDDVRPAYSLAIIDLNQGRLDRAQTRLEAVVARAPDLAAAQHNLGAVRQALGRWGGAAEAYGRAVALQPAAGESRVGLAMALAALGQLPQALAENRVLTAQPAYRWAALTRVALLDSAAITDEDLTTMQAAAADPTVAEAERIGLFFALGEVLERRGRDTEAFDAYAAGNGLNRARIDPAAAAEANARAADYVLKTITPAFAAANQGRGDRATAPIFIVGMPRSGSTLIEQMLGAHPQVQALGETGVLPRLLQDGYPKSGAALADLAARYREGLRARGWDGRLIPVDKTLENYLHAGLIGVLFPRAVILHAVRDPIDTSFACWRQLFAGGNETLYDFADIGAEYRRYRRLMAGWEALAPGRIAELRYEALVAEPEAQARRLLEIAGLPWNPDILRFHEQAGVVQTASVAQVRQPLYTTSVQRWRRHAEQLQPLIDALGDYATV